MHRQARFIYLALALLAVNIAACQIAPTTAGSPEQRIERQLNDGETKCIDAKNLAAALVRGNTITADEAEHIGKVADGATNNLLQARYALDAKSYDVAQGWVDSSAPMLGELTDFYRKYTTGGYK